MTRYENRQEIFEKMNWEGGLEMFLDYGFSAEDLPEGDAELSEVTNDMLLAWEDYQLYADRFMGLFSDCEGYGCV